MEESNISKSLATYFVKVKEFEDTEFKVEIIEDGAIKRLSINGEVYDVDYNVGGDTIHSIIINNKSNGVQISSNSMSGKYEVMHRGNLFQLEVLNEMAKMRKQRSDAQLVGRQVISALMPGMIQKLFVKEGDKVMPGTPLCVLEAMKMENEIQSPTEGIVSSIYIKEGDKVMVHDKLIIVE